LDLAPTRRDPHRLVAAAEARQPGPPLLGLSLLGVFVAARLAVVAGRGVLLLSPWSPFALMWQDLLAAAAFMALERGLRRAHLAQVVYAASVVWVALNAAVARVLGTPLTWPMIRAARGPLADSIRHSATAEPIGAFALVAALGVALPLLLRRRRSGLGHAAILGVAGIIALGFAVASRVETFGLERNAIVALAASSLPRLPERVAVETDWRAGPPEPGPDLRGLRGRARGYNAVLVMLESAGAQYLGAYGARPDPMPRLTDLARGSLLFEHAYAVYPESVKGLFSVLCSAYPGFDTDPELYRRYSGPSLAGELRSAGYRTGLFHSGRFMYLGMEAILAERGFETLEDAGWIGGNRNSSFGIDEPSAVRRLLAWIDTAPRPFFAVYLPVAGHHPYATGEPGPFPEARDIDRYLNALHEADAAVGAILDGLRARGLDGSTALLIAGDHGEAFGQHAGNYGHTSFVYEENVRVPLVIAAPGAAPMRIGGAASLIDAAPTLLDLLGRSIPRGFQGRSLLAGVPRSALFFTDYSLGLLGLRDGCRKYVFELESRRSRLFDLCSDPAETVDLAARDPGWAAVYRDRLERWAAAQRARVVQIR
jgi:lipoteichoic acid synthase